MAGPILGLPRYTSESSCSVDVNLCLLTVWLLLSSSRQFIFFREHQPWAAIVSVGMALPIFVASGLYRSIFRYSGWPAILAVSRAVAIYGLLYVASLQHLEFQVSPMPSD